MKTASLGRQRGAVLLAMLAVLVLGGMWYLVSRLSAASGDFTAATRMRNALVLNQAKQALIGYVAAQAAKSAEPRPGALPCPEAAGTDGQAAGNCSLPKVGRFPWRTIGTDQLVDASGEPLWYVVGPGWAYTSGSPDPIINSNTSGQLTVDGALNDAVALIIAPGPAFQVAAAPGCAAWPQVRPSGGALDWRNYLECENATSPADSIFVTSGPSGSFNDQVLRVTAADLLPGIEAAVAHRMERDIGPKLKQVYTAANGWALSPGVALPAGTSLYPYAAPFSNPEAIPDTPNTPDRVVYTGAAGNYVGLIPIAKQIPGSVAWVNPATGFTLSLLGPGVLSITDCSGSNSTLFSCSIVFLVASSFTLDVDASNIGTGFRQAPGLQSNLVATGGTGTVSNSLRSDGSARVRITITPSFPVAGTVTVSLPINAADAVTDDISTNETWYFYNGWHKLTAYMVSKGLAPGPGGVPTTPVGDCGGANPPCLTINNSRYPTTTKRAALILAGRALAGQVRPSAALADYLEGENLSPLDEVLRRGASSSVINDRVVAVDP